MATPTCTTTSYASTMKPFESIGTVRKHMGTHGTLKIATMLSVGLPTCPSQQPESVTSCTTTQCSAHLTCTGVLSVTLNLVVGHKSKRMSKMPWATKSNCHCHQHWTEKGCEGTHPNLSQNDQPTWHHISFGMASSNNGYHHHHQVHHHQRLPTHLTPHSHMQHQDDQHCHQVQHRHQVQS